MRRAAIWLALVVLNVILLPAPRGQANDFKIIPGERVGDVSITMSIDDILKLLGTPTKVERTSATLSLYEWRGHQIKVYQDLNSGRVGAVRTYWLFRTSNSYSTEKGIRVGASPEQIRQAYGDAGCLVREGQGWREFWWNGLGIDFIINTDPSSPAEIQGKVTEFGVRRITTQSPAPGLGYRPCSG